MSALWSNSATSPKPLQRLLREFLLSVLQGQISDQQQNTELPLFSDLDVSYGIPMVVDKIPLSSLDGPGVEIVFPSSFSSPF